MTASITVAQLTEQLKQGDQAQEIQFLIVDAKTSEVLQVDLRDNLVDIQKLMKVFKKPTKVPQKISPDQSANRTWNALLNFALDSGTEDPLELLQMWREGAFDEIREEWPNAPKEIFPA